MTCVASSVQHCFCVHGDGQWPLWSGQWQVDRWRSEDGLNRLSNIGMVNYRIYCQRFIYYKIWFLWKIGYYAQKDVMKNENRSTEQNTSFYARPRLHKIVLDTVRMNFQESGFTERDWTGKFLRNTICVPIYYSYELTLFNFSFPSAVCSRNMKHVFLGMIRSTSGDISPFCDDFEQWMLCMLALLSEI